MAGASSWCSQSGAHCRACGGHGTWCGQELEQVLMKKDTSISSPVQRSHSMPRQWVVGVILFVTVPISLAAAFLGGRRFRGAIPASRKVAGLADASDDARPPVVYEQLMTKQPGQSALVLVANAESGEAA